MITKVKLAEIRDNPYQPRERYEDIEELAAKIAAMKAQLPDTLGLIHPPNARRVDGVVQLAEGHRRLRAFMHLEADDPDYAEMPVNLVSLSDEDMDDIAWSENRDRKDLTPIEEARALKRTLETRGLTQEQLAALRHLGRSTVANKIRLLGLPDDLLEAVANGQVSERQAIDLLPALEIKSSDMDGAGLTRNVHFTPGSAWDVPTPNTLKCRVLEFGNLTGDQIRMTVEQIRKKVDEAKLERWKKENPPAPQVEVAAPVTASAAGSPLPPPPAGPARQAPPPPPPVRDVCGPVRDVCGQTMDEPAEDEEEERDWLEPEDRAFEGEEESDGGGMSMSPDKGGEPEQAHSLPAPPPPPPPAPKPQPKPVVMWQVTISIKQDGDAVGPGSGTIISLFKNSELVKSYSIACAGIQTTLSNILTDELPGGVRFNFNE
jgi:ParB/RepB/Spo0J family partition protein